MEPQQDVTQVGNEAQVDILPSRRVMAEPLVPQQGDQPCPTCGSQARATGDGFFVPSFIYAVGRVEWRFPRLAVEKEFAQATRRALDAKRIKAGSPESENKQAVLSLPENRYLARQLCWVFRIENMETYILQPRNPVDFDLLVETVRPTPSLEDVDVVIGLRGPIAPSEMCPGLGLYIVVFDQIYSFPRDTLFAAIRAPEKATDDQKKHISASAQDLWNRIAKVADNAGATDEHRALNYLAVSYDRIYTHTSERYLNDFDFTRVDVIPSRLSGIRKLLNVTFSYTHRQTGVTEKYRVRVDVTEEFPFLDRGLEPYYDIER